MQTMEKVKVAGFVDRGYNANRRQKRIEDEEAEIKRLEAKLRGEEIEEVVDNGDTEEEVEEGNSQTAESGTSGDGTQDEDAGKL